LTCGQKSSRYQSILDQARQRDGQGTIKVPVERRLR
jgi:hypothetical protein